MRQKIKKFHCVQNQLGVSGITNQNSNMYVQYTCNFIHHQKRINILIFFCFFLFFIFMQVCRMSLKMQWRLIHNGLEIFFSFFSFSRISIVNSTDVNREVRTQQCFTIKLFFYSCELTIKSRGNIQQQKSDKMTLVAFNNEFS